jgi:predicted transcriptional regulator
MAKVPMTINLEPDTALAIEILAERLMIARAFLLRRIVEEYIEENREDINAGFARPDSIDPTFGEELKIPGTGL